MSISTHTRAGSKRSRDEIEGEQRHRSNAYTRLGKNVVNGRVPGLAKTLDIEEETSLATQDVEPASDEHPAIIEASSSGDYTSRDESGSENDSGYESASSSEGEEQPVGDADGVPRLGLRHERPNRVNIPTRSGSKRIAKSSDRRSHGSAPECDRPSTEYEPVVVVNGTGCESESEPEPGDTTSNGLSSSDDGDDTGLYCEDTESDAPSLQEPRNNGSDDKKAQASLSSSLSLLRQAESTGEMLKAQSHGLRTDKTEAELIAEKKMADAIALANRMEAIQKKAALHATERVKAMDVCFLKRAAMLVKHAKKTGEWGTTPDDIRLRTTYDLAAFEDEQTEIVSRGPLDEDRPRVGAGTPHGGRFLKQRDELVPPSGLYSFVGEDGPYKGHWFEIGEIQGANAPVDLLRGETVSEESRAPCNSKSPRVFRHKLRCRRTGEIFTVRTDEVANDVWQRHRTTLEATKAEKKARQVDEEGFKMCQEILNIRAAGRKERRAGRLSMDCTVL
ncbi:hypothetical protein ONZ51_g3620 [Trametes cubensis]|uniref:Uncharacterized protein n=1 Tax=Trametes cubensis TaxID=1111947 RepID=A0AAD7TXD3_9APHY|nr:hypothetical protein ONZ51_g3620 [Trametes cubensis]